MVIAVLEAIGFPWLSGFPLLLFLFRSPVLVLFHLPMKSFSLKKLLSLWQIAIAVSGERKDCRHGTYMPDTETCSCDRHWNTAGITDTIDFLEGVCEQYQCVSDQVCRENLRGHIDLDYVSCPVPKWNCYCGWKYAFMSGWHGFETPRYENVTNSTGAVRNSTGAECMGVMYTFSVWSYLTLKWLIQQVVIITLTLFVVLLCFGKKRIRCDHHDPSLLKEIRKLCGSPPDCTGGCHVQGEGWTLDRITDDFAWSFYALSLGIWTLIFLVVLFGLAMFAWSVVLWAMVLLLIIVAAVAGLCMLCGEGAGGHSCDCGGCSCDCCGCDPGAGLIDDGTLADTFYWGGPHPLTGPFWCDVGGFGSTEDSCWSCNGFCFPIAWLVLRFPRMPDNLWGGVVGRFLGTHSFAAEDRAYRGGSDCIDFLGLYWMRAGDLHGHNEWRVQVHDFLYRFDAAELPYHDIGTTSDDGTSYHRIGNATIQLLHRKFGEGDRCVPSSFEDYRNNKCWICQQEDEIDWDLWLTCKHMYCQNCSEKMLRRRMPCPLCRVFSTSIWRGYRSNGSIPSHAPNGVSSP